MVRILCAVCLSMSFLNCAAHKLIIDPAEYSVVKLYMIPHAIIIRVDTIKVDNSKMLQIKYFGKENKSRD